ncbi:hypothetical protein MalM14_52700 [Gimesia chilikensis]|nr:hypothetical protein MalM14_52700 [Gimesia chilikensis]
MDRACFVLWLLRVLSGMVLLLFHAADSAEGRGGVKTEFCPDVAGFCPGVSGILSHSGRGLSASALLCRRLFRRGAQCSGEKQMKIAGVGGADVTLVREMQCSEDAPRARARWEPGYDLEGVDQGQSVQAVVVDFQWGRIMDRRWRFFLPRKSRSLFGLTRSFQVSLRPHSNATLDCSLPGGRTHRSAPYDEGWWAGSGSRVCAAISCCLRQSRIVSGTTQGT